MKNIILIFTLLFSVNASAFVDDSVCRIEKQEFYNKLTKLEVARGDANKRAEKAYKQCICMTGNLARDAAESLTESYEKEVIITGPTARVVTAPIEYGSDMYLMSFENDEDICYLQVSSPEACKNAGFMSAASGYFAVHDTYDPVRDICVTDKNWLDKVSK